MAADLSEFAAIAGKGPKPCKFARVEAEMDPAWVETLRAAVEAGYGANTISKWLSTRGLHISDGAVSRHIGGSCTCLRPAA